MHPYALPDPQTRRIGALDLWIVVLTLRLGLLIFLALPKTPAAVGRLCLHAINITVTTTMIALAAGTSNPAPGIPTHIAALAPSPTTDTLPTTPRAPQPLDPSTTTPTLGRPGAGPLALARSAPPTPRPDELCAALNIYHEARGESRRGQIMVTQVAINRTARGYKNARTLCGTIFAPAQFSWTLENPRQPTGAELAPYMRLARTILSGQYPDYARGALHYYNPTTVDAWWQHAYVEVAVVGKHRFMR